MPDLAPALQLTDQEAELLINLLAQQAVNAEVPFVGDGELQWDPSNKPEWVRKAEAAQLHREAEVATLLGETKYRAWQDYAASIEARRLVRQLRPMLDGTTESLRDDQMQSLVKAIAQAQQRFGEDVKNEAVPRDGMERFLEYHEYLRDAATPWLSRQQLARFNQMLDRQLDTERAHRSPPPETEESVVPD